MIETVEQQARNMLERAGVEYAQSLSASSLAEIGNLIVEVYKLRRENERLQEWKRKYSQVVEAFETLKDLIRKEDGED